MHAKGLSPVIHQQKSLDAAARDIDALHYDGAKDFATALRNDPSLTAEAASGRTQRAMEAMRAETKLRIEAPARADRFVAEWQKGLKQLREHKANYDDVGAKRVGAHLNDMAKSLHRDPQLESLLRNRTHELGLKSLEKHSVSQALQDYLEAFRRLTERPALALTPEVIRDQVRTAGARARETEQQALREARSRLDEAVKSIGLVVASARTQEQQNFWVAVAAGVAAILAFMAGCTVPSAVDRAVPEDWHWPERRAATLLERNMWGTGVRLMRVGDPPRWNAVARASRLYEGNEKKVADCQKQAERKKKAVACTIKVQPLSGQ